MKGNGEGKNAAVLELKDIKVAYGGIQAVKGVSLRVVSGELIALVGSNGAGKSTTLKAICRLVPLTHGSVYYDGVDVTRIPAHELVQRGMALVPEGRGIFGQLTVEENLIVGAYTRSDKSAIEQDVEQVYARFPRLKERRRQSAGTLSGGEQQMVAIGRALMGRPKLLLLDEPSMGLAPAMLRKIFEVITQIPRDGVTVLLVTQNARLALEVSDRAYVMETGRITLSGPASSLLDDPQVQQAYLGA